MIIVKHLSTSRVLNHTPNYNSTFARNVDGFFYRLYRLARNHRFLVRKLAVPVIIKKLNNLEIKPITGNVDLLVGKLDYSFKNIMLSDVKIPVSNISVFNQTGISVKGTQITIKINELWNYKFKSWPFVSDKGSCTVSAKDLSLNIIIGLSKGSKDEPSVAAKDCKLDIGNLDIKFRGGASFLYNLFALFTKDRLKDEMEEVICDNAKKAVNKEIKRTLKNIPGVVNNIVKHMSIPRASTNKR